MFGLFKNRRNKGQDKKGPKGNAPHAPQKDTESAGDTKTLPLIGEDGTVKAAPASVAPSTPSPGDTGRIPTVDVADHFGAAVTDVAKLRYQIEHQLLPQQLFEDPAKLLGLLEVGGDLYSLYRQVFEASGATFPYTLRDFSVLATNLGDDYRVVSLYPPAPEITPLCHRIHIVHDASLTKLGYYTIERGQSGGYLCFWDEQGRHHNVNHIEAPENTDDMLLAMEIVVIGKLHEERFEKN